MERVRPRRNRLRSLHVRQDADCDGQISEKDFCTTVMHGRDIDQRDFAKLGQRWEEAATKMCKEKGKLMWQAVVGKKLDL